MTKADTAQREKIIVLDFGSQYAHLIAKRFRLLGYYSEIALPSASAQSLEGAKGIVLSGGPASVYSKDAPEFNAEILGMDVPVLGLCYGHYIVNLGYGGRAEKARTGEFGHAVLELSGAAQCPLFDGISSPQQVWMSHQDELTLPGSGFETVASTKDCRHAALQNLKERRFSLQFHCEVKDTPCGNRIFENFARLCGMDRNWNQDAVLQHILESIRTEAQDRSVLLFLSGGVDSTVAFALLNKALGQQRVLGLHIDNGFMRKGESAVVARRYMDFGMTNFITEDAGATFLKAVEGLCDPQAKRMAAGETFIAVRDAVVARQGLADGRWLLAQGTLYPDIIESGGTKNSNVIKTHHNRVAGIQALIDKGLVIEPLRDLYKDEVRVIGKRLGLSDELVMRHPFPGPGLSINVLCSTGELSDADRAEIGMARAELAAVRLTQFCEHCTRTLRREILPVRSVGVQGDFRTYRFPAALTFRPEEDGFFHLPRRWEKLEEASSAITNASGRINRCVVRLWQAPNLHVDGSGLRLHEGYCTKARLDQTREADAIVLSELKKAGWYGRIFQHLTINLPYASDKDHCSLVLRPVCSEDVMTARFAPLPQELVREITARIAALGFVDAVFYDITNKPPATFGWE